MPDRCTVNLLLEVEESSQQHELLTNAVMDVAVRGAESFLSQVPGGS